MKKVLFVMHNLGYGGAERSLVNLLYELPKDKYAVDILLFQKKGALLAQLPKWVNVLETPKELNALYAPVSKAGSRVFTKLLGTAVSRLARKTRKARAGYRWKTFYCSQIQMLPQVYDVAVAYGGSELMYYVGDRVQAKRKLVWIHSDYRTGQYSAEYDYPYLASVHGIVSISNVCVDILKEIFPEFQEKIHCIENITSSSLLRKRAEAFVPKEYRKERLNLLTVGRLSGEKGMDLAVSAAAVLKKSGLDFCWYVLGNGPLREKLEKQISQLDVADCFVLLGNHSNPYPYMKHCDILIQPSRWEGKSMVLDEAKILNVPIVATAYLTVRDQIAEGQEGLIVPMTGQGIAEGVLQLANDSEQLAAIRSYLSSHEYGNSAEVQKYMDIIDAINI